MGVCVHMCVCTHMCLWICAYACMRRCVYMYGSVCVYLCVCVLVYVCVCARADRHIRLSSKFRRLRCRQCGNNGMGSIEADCGPCRLGGTEGSGDCAKQEARVPLKGQMQLSPREWLLCGMHTQCYQAFPVFKRSQKEGFLCEMFLIFETQLSAHHGD